MRHRSIKAPRVPIPSDCVVGAKIALSEGRGLILAVSQSHILCAMIWGVNAEVLGYQIARWDTRQEPVWQCVRGGWHLYRTSAERHLSQLIEVEEKKA